MSKVESSEMIDPPVRSRHRTGSESRSDDGTPPSDSGLKVIDLRKSFQAPNGERIDVLRGVTLSMQPGESVAITGASGSGKSTLLHLMGGLDVADHGTISLGQKDLGCVESRELAKLRQNKIGFVFQFHYLLPDLSAVENVALPLLIGRCKTSAALLLARNALSALGLEDRTDHPVSHLSGGEQQRVAVARALIGRPELVLADEPTGNLDAAISEEIGRTLTLYARTHFALVVVATHNQSLARLCDRVFMLKDGRIYSS
jgi:ABC-type lipoprotein export system ATPase subunit